MINANGKVTITLGKETIKQLKIMQKIGAVDNQTNYCKKVLTDKIKADFKKYQDIATKNIKENL